MTRELVKIPSESSDPVSSSLSSPEKKVLEYLTALCRRAELQYHTSEALPGRENLIVRLPNPGAPRLVIVGHMDTVSGAGMDDPFCGDLRDGRIIGRGACDDKGPLAVGLAAVIAVHRDLGVAPAYDITFAGSIDEECTMSGAESLAKELPDWDLCIALEPTDLKIINAHKGIYRCRITTRGKAAHSSHPDQGRNAVTAMIPIIHDIDALRVKLARNKHPDMGRASLAVTTIRGGSSVNTIPDLCEAVVDIRLLPDMQISAVAEQVRKCVGDRGEVEGIHTCDGISTSMDNPLISALTDSIKAGGTNPGPITASFATDCSRLHHKGPCIVWGPGNIHQAHQTTEYIAVDQLERAFQILKDFLAG